VQTRMHFGTVQTGGSVVTKAVASETEAKTEAAGSETEAEAQGSWLIF